MINCNVPHISTFSFLFTRKAVPLRSNYPVKLLKYYVTDSEIETNRTQIQTRNTSNWPFVHFIECWFYCCCWYLSLSNSACIEIVFQHIWTESNGVIKFKCKNSQSYQSTKSTFLKKENKYTNTWNWTSLFFLLVW